jgi:hypothetical protein
MIVRVLDFLSEDLYKDFRMCAEKVDSLDLKQVLKANWFIRVEKGRPTFGVKVRYDLETNGSYDKVEGVDGHVQKIIFESLWRYYKEGLARIESSGQDLLERPIKTNVFRAEFQFTDKRSTFKKHTHPHSQVNGSLYIYPDESAGTKFYEPDFEAPWDTNSLIVFTDQNHSFENQSHDHRRFTINTFLEVK